MGEDHLLEGAEPHLARLLRCALHPAHGHLVDHQLVVVAQLVSRGELIVPAERLLPAPALADPKDPAIAAEAGDMDSVRIGDGIVDRTVFYELVFIVAVFQTQVVEIDFEPAWFTRNRGQGFTTPAMRVVTVALQDIGKAQFKLAAGRSGYPNVRVSSWSMWLVIVI